jgi:hypothetical protein
VGEPEIERAADEYPELVDQVVTGLAVRYYKAVAG